MKFSYLFISIVLLFHSCESWKGKITSKDDDRIPVARVGTHYLYDVDLKGIVSEESLEEDSVIAIQNYIESWVKQKLMLDMAINQLQDDSKDIEKRLADYRESLFTYKYEQEYLKQNLDTIVSENEIESYYSEFEENFKLAEHLAKYFSVTVKDDYPKQDSIRYWLSNIDNEYFQLEKYCVETSAECWLQEEEWLAYSEMQHKIPGLNVQMLAKGRVSLHVLDDTKSYILLLDFLPKNQVAPLEYKRDEIEKILINKKRIELIKQLNDEVYEDGLRANKFEIY